MAVGAIICQKLLMERPGFELVGDGEIQPDPHWHLAPHFHSTHHELILILRGSLLLKTPDRELLAAPGDVLFYEKGMVHEEISHRNNPVNLLFIAFRYPKWRPSFPLRMHDTDGRLRELFSWLIRDRRNGRPVHECLFLCRAIVEELKWINTEPRSPWLESTLTFMRKNFARKLDLAEIARQAGMSRFAFIRKFKRLTGHTPMGELRRIRLNEARNLILSSSLPLKLIAPASGLGDEYQLSKLFRRYFGLSPRGLRAQKVEGRRTTRI